MNSENDRIHSVIDSIPWFSKLHPSCIQQLTDMAQIGSIQKGDRLFSEGDSPDYLFVLISGLIALEIHVPTRGSIRLETVEPTDLFGWSGVTERAKRRTATTVAIQDSEYLAFPSKKLMGLIDRDPQLGYCVFNRVANTIADRLQVTRFQLLDIFASPQEAD